MNEKQFKSLVNILPKHGRGKNYADALDIYLVSHAVKPAMLAGDDFCFPDSKFRDKLVKWIEENEGCNIGVKQYLDECIVTSGSWDGKFFSSKGYTEEEYYEKILDLEKVDRRKDSYNYEFFCDIAGNVYLFHGFESNDHILDLNDERISEVIDVIGGLEMVNVMRLNVYNLKRGEEGSGKLVNIINYYS